MVCCHRTRTTILPSITPDPSLFLCLLLARPAPCRYDAHWDWFDDPVHHAAYLHEGNRYATVLMYLAGACGEWGGLCFRIPLCAQQQAMM